MRRWRGEPDHRSLLGVYLRDHLAGAVAGISLVRRCRRSNSDSDLGRMLATIEAELVADRQTLEEIMARLHVRKSRIKQLIGLGVELIGRLKTNGRVFSYSPSSRVVELEVLASGVFTRRSLWLSLRSVVDDYPEFDAAQLDRLIAKATEQDERLLAEHDLAAAIAFGSSPVRIAP